MREIEILTLEISFGYIRNYVVPFIHNTQVPLNSTEDGINGLQVQEIITLQKVLVCW